MYVYMYMYMYISLRSICMKYCYIKLIYLHIKWNMSLGYEWNIIGLIPR